jgi:hypothetical protein
MTCCMHKGNKKWIKTWFETISTRGPTDWAFVLLPEDGSRTNFQNIVVLITSRQLTNSKKIIQHNVSYHCQKPSDFDYSSSVDHQIWSDIFGAPTPDAWSPYNHWPKITNLLDIIHPLFFIKTHNVSETGVCLCHQVKGTYSVGPNK